MATFTISEAISMINGILDKVAADAEQYMKSYIANNTKDATGALEKSIHVDSRGESERAVGTDLPYAYYVDKGRGPVEAKKIEGKPKHTLHYVYPRNGGGKDFFPKRVAAAKGINFIGKTKEYLESKHY